LENVPRAGAHDSSEGGLLLGEPSAGTLFLLLRGLEFVPGTGGDGALGTLSLASTSAVLLLLRGSLELIPGACSDSTSEGSLFLLEGRLLRRGHLISRGLLDQAGACIIHLWCLENVPGSSGDDASEGLLLLIEGSTASAVLFLLRGGLEFVPGAGSYGASERRVLLLKGGLIGGNGVTDWSSLSQASTSAVLFLLRRSLEFVPGAGSDGTSEGGVLLLEGGLLGGT